MFKNGHQINATTGTGLLLVIKAWQQAHGNLCNCCPNAEDAQKDKRVVVVIPCTLLRESL